MNNFFKNLFNFKSMPFDFLSSGLFNGVDFNFDSNGGYEMTSVTDGMEVKTSMDADRNITLSVKIDVDETKEAKDATIDIVLTMASRYFGIANKVNVNLTMNDVKYVFTGNVLDGTFCVVLEDGRTGRAVPLSSDDYIKTWVLEPDTCVPVSNDNTTEPDTEPDVCYETADYTSTSTEDVEDETHVYTDEEIDRYANFMCNVVCGDCVRDTCVGCEVVGESDNDACNCEGCNCEDCDGCGVVCPLSETISNDEITIPNTLEDCDFANFIKNKHRHVVDYDKMMSNLRNVLVNNDYDIEDNYVVVPMEDVIKEDDFLKDMEIVDIALNKEKDRLESFLVQATNKFGFKSFKYENDTVFGLIDLKFELPE